MAARAEMQPDDYVVYDRTGVDVPLGPLRPSFELAHLQADGSGPQFHTRLEAETRGRERAQQARVALWYHGADGVIELIANYRAPAAASR